MYNSLISEICSCCTLSAFADTHTLSLTNVIKLNIIGEHEAQLL